MTVLGESSEAIQKYQNNTTYKFFQDLMLEAANIGFKNLVNKNSLTAKQCFIDSSETPHEILFYKIVKKDRNGNQLQTFILPSPAEESKTRRKLLNFFDAQVKYDKQYEYEISAYPLVLAKKYYYSPFYADDKNAFRWKTFMNLMRDLRTEFFINSPKIKLAANLGKGLDTFENRILTYIRQWEKTNTSNYKSSGQKQAFNLTILAILLDFQNLFRNLQNAQLDFQKYFTGFTSASGRRGYYDQLFKQIDTVVYDFYINSGGGTTKSIFSNPQAQQQLGFPIAGYRDAMVNFVLLFTTGLLITEGLTTTSDLRKEITATTNEYFNTAIRNFEIAQGRNLFTTDFDKIKISTSDYIVLMEVPLFSIEGKVLENPPIYPEVHFSGVKGKNNQIFISLKTQTTRMYEKPIPFNDIEEDYFNNLIKSKGTDRNGRLLFKTDDENRKFQIFRLEERPKSYKDFDQQIRREIDLQGKYAGATYRDRLLPNKKYYYTFRSMDVHDNLSNPSPVYEVVVNDQAGFIFPEFKVIQLEDKDYYQYTQSFRKYLEIKPSFENTIIDTDITDNFKSAYGLGLGGVAPLGSGVDNAWGKKFKVRITSKSSGKKVDINFDFTKKYVGDVVTASDVAGYGVISEEDRTNMATLPESERPTQELGQSTPILEDSDFFKRKEE